MIQAIVTIMGVEYSTDFEDWDEAEQASQELADMYRPDEWDIELI